MGVVTATVGEIIRDVLGQEPTIVLRQEVYVPASLSGAISYVGSLGLGATPVLAAGVGIGIAFSIRCAALNFSWAAPKYKPRPGKDI